jgi:hypothetical protein
MYKEIYFEELAHEVGKSKSYNPKGWLLAEFLLRKVSLFYSDLQVIG